jgi:hypothetical protein
VTDPRVEELERAIRLFEERLAFEARDFRGGCGRTVVDAARAHLARLRAPAAGAPSEAVATLREAFHFWPSLGHEHTQARKRAHAALDEIEAFIKAAGR